MNRDDIIQMAQSCWPSDRRMWAVDADLPRLERFAALVADEEIQRLRALVRAQQITIDKLEQQPAAWVGLTDADMKKLCEDWDITLGGWANGFMRAIEAKLREKNGGAA